MRKGVLTDTEYAISLFGSQNTLIEYLMQDNEDSVMDESDHDWRLRDDSAKEIMKRITQCASVSDFQKLDFPIQKEYAGQLYLKRLSMGHYRDVQNNSIQGGTESERRARRKHENPFARIGNGGIL